MSLAALVLVLAAVPAQAEDPGAVAREILAGGGQQSELPQGRGGLGELPEDGGAPGARGGGPKERSSGSRSARAEPEPGAPAWRLPPALTEFLFWGLLIAALVLVLFVLVQLIASRVRDGPEPARSTSPAPVAGANARAPAPEERLDDPDRLAGEGRYAEAIHVLLLRALRALPRASFAPGATAREIAAAAALDARRRAALSGLVQAVERSLFAALVPAREDYESCVRLAGVLRSTHEG